MVSILVPSVPLLEHTIKMLKGEVAVHDKLGLSCGSIPDRLLVWTDTGGVCVAYGHSPPKGDEEFRGIVLVEVIWKTVLGIFNH